jgi:hypothetical protein
VILFVVAIAGWGLVPSHAGAQMTETPTPLPGLMGAMVVDPATSHVFVSLYDASEVVVLDFDGNIVGTIPGLAGARGLAVVGNHVYVAAANAGAIDEIDTGTLTITRTVATGLVSMDDLVAAGGALWAMSSGNLTRVAIADGAKTSYGNVAGTGLVGDPADPNMLFEFDPGSSPFGLARLDISSLPPTVGASQAETTPVIISNVHDIAVSPDGTHVIPAGGAPYQFDELAAGNLLPTGVVYPANPYPTAVAMTSANGGLFAGGMNGLYDNDIVLYRLGDSSSEIATHDFGSTSQTLVPGGLAFSPDGTRLFAVTGTSPTDTFHVMSVGALPPPSTTTTVAGATTTTAPTTTTTTVAVSPPSVYVAPRNLAFGNQRVGTYGNGIGFTIESTGTTLLTLNALSVGGADPYDFFGKTNCFPNGQPRLLYQGQSCQAIMYFAPLAHGARHATLSVMDNATDSPQLVSLSGNGTEGYFLAGSHGQIGNFGDAVFHGDATKLHLNAPMISMSTTPNGAGYWLLGRDGGIFTYGNARFYGSTGNRRLNKPIVTMAATPDGRGYWLIASDGGVFCFGDATFHGSTGGLHLNKPIVGMASTPSGRGYWLVASDGGIFTFGDARYYGSAGALHLASTVMQMTRTPSGRGYWIVTSDGHLFAYGDAHNYGSAVGHAVVGMAPTPDGRGYWETARDGSVYPYGDAPNYGSLPSHGIHTDDVIAIAGTAPALPPALLGVAALSYTRPAGALALRPSSIGRLTQLRPLGMHG